MLLEQLINELYYRINGTKIKVRRVQSKRRFESLLLSTFRPTKKVVGRVKNMTFEIYTNDHNPPHFHVKADNYKAKFRIVDPIKLDGDMPTFMIKIILSWANTHQDRLIKIWNESRPYIIEKKAE